MARSQRRRSILTDFEACSLALFAALVLSAAPQARAQTFGPAGVQSSTPSTTATTATRSQSGAKAVPAKPAKPAGQPASAPQPAKR